MESSGHIDQSAFNIFAPSAVNAHQTCRRAQIKEAARKWAGERLHLFCMQSQYMNYNLCNRVEIMMLFHCVVILFLWY